MTASIRRFSIQLVLLPCLILSSVASMAQIPAIEKSSAIDLFTSWSQFQAGPNASGVQTWTFPGEYRDIDIVREGSCIFFNSFKILEVTDTGNAFVYEYDDINSLSNEDAPVQTWSRSGDFVGFAGNFNRSADSSLDANFFVENNSPTSTLWQEWTDLYSWSDDEPFWNSDTVPFADWIAFSEVVVCESGGFDNLYYPMTMRRNSVGGTNIHRWPDWNAFRAGQGSTVVGENLNTAYHGLEVVRDGSEIYALRTIEKNLCPDTAIFADPPNPPTGISLPDDVFYAGGLVWKKWDETIGQSIPQAEDQYGPDGWRVATRAEVVDLVNSRMCEGEADEIFTVGVNTETITYPPSQQPYMASFVEEILGCTDGFCGAQAGVFSSALFFDYSYGDGMTVGDIFAEIGSPPGLEQGVALVKGPQVNLVWTHRNGVPLSGGDGQLAHPAGGDIFEANVLVSDGGTCTGLSSFKFDIKWDTQYLQALETTNHCYTSACIDSNSNTSEGMASFLPATISGGSANFEAGWIPTGLPGSEPPFRCDEPLLVGYLKFELLSLPNFIETDLEVDYNIVTGDGAITTDADLDPQEFDYRQFEPPEDIQLVGCSLI